MLSGFLPCAGILIIPYYLVIHIKKDRKSLTFNSWKEMVFQLPVKRNQTVRSQLMLHAVWFFFLYFYFLLLTFYLTILLHISSYSFDTSMIAPVSAELTRAAYLANAGFLGFTTGTQPSFLLANSSSDTSIFKVRL